MSPSIVEEEYRSSQLQKSDSDTAEGDEQLSKAQLEQDPKSEQCGFGRVLTAAQGYVIEYTVYEITG